MTSSLHTVSVFAPATIANVGSAFDVLGCALDAPGDTVTIERTTTPGVRIVEISGDRGRLPKDPEQNTAGVSVQALLKHYLSHTCDPTASWGFNIRLTKGLPIGSGLGSSSASTVAAAVAANELLGNPLSRRDLMQFAMEGERVACGAAHADNIAPCLLGGFVLIRSYNPLDIITLPSPRNVWIAVVSPELELRTSDARRVLKRSVALESAISQWGNVAALVAGIYQEDIDLMGRSLEDAIIEPERAALIPGYHSAKSAALASGAAGCSISGSGPSVFALCRSEQIVHATTQAMAAAFDAVGVSSIQHISRINEAGAKVVRRE